MLWPRIQPWINAYITKLILVSLTTELSRYIYHTTSLEYHKLARHRGLKRKMFGVSGGGDVGQLCKRSFRYVIHPLKNVYSVPHHLWAGQIIMVLPILIMHRGYFDGKLWFDMIDQMSIFVCQSIGNDSGILHNTWAHCANHLGWLIFWYDLRKDSLTISRSYTVIPWAPYTAT
jgi:hypothetical protein